MKYSKEERENAAAHLRKVLKDGDTVYTVLRSVSRSGMFRRIDLYYIDDSDYMRRANNGRPRMQYLSGYAAVVMGIPRNDKGLGVGGCGMDMGFHLVGNLAAALFGFEKTGTGHRVKGEFRQEWI